MALETDSLKFAGEFERYLRHDVALYICFHNKL